MNRLARSCDIVKAHVTTGVIRNSEFRILVLFCVVGWNIPCTTTPGGSGSFANSIKHDVQGTVSIVLKFAIQKLIELTFVANQNLVHSFLAGAKG